MSSSIKGTWFCSHMKRLIIAINGIDFGSAFQQQASEKFIRCSTVIASVSSSGMDNSSHQPGLADNLDAPKIGNFQIRKYYQDNSSRKGTTYEYCAASRCHHFKTLLGS